MAFNVYNFKVMLDIAEEHGIDRQLVVDCHINSIKHPTTKKLVKYIIDETNQNAPCHEAIVCSDCEYNPICVVQDRPRDPSIEYGMITDSLRDIVGKNNNNNSLGDLFGSLGAGNFVDFDKDKKE